MGVVSHSSKPPPPTHDKDPGGPFVTTGWGGRIYTKTVVFLQQKQAKFSIKKFLKYQPLKNPSYSRNR